MSKYSEVAKKAAEAYVYIPFNGEAITIRATILEAGIMYGTGEETGDEYTIYFDDVDIENDMFYKLQLI